MNIQDFQVVEELCPHGRSQPHGNNLIFPCLGPKTRSADLDDIDALLRTLYGEGKYKYIPLSDETLARGVGGEMI